MKKIFMLLICIVTLFCLPVVVFADTEVEEAPTMVEISSWDEFEAAFKNVDKYSGKSYIFKLTKDLLMETKDFTSKQTGGISVRVYGCDITFDFNGHTLNCKVDRDNINNFISVYLACASSEEPVNLTFADSVGGGGVFMESKRNDKKTLSALYIAEDFVYEGVIPYKVMLPCNKVTFDGGIFSLDSEVTGRNYYWTDISDTNRYIDYNYRGAVVVDHVGKIEINDGLFVARALTNAANSPLAAFGTTSMNCSRTLGVHPTEFVINGGAFQSDGSAVRYFNDNWYNTKDYVMMPTINGGIFVGNLDFRKSLYEQNSTNDMKDRRIYFSDRANVIREYAGNEHTYRWACCYDLYWNTDTLVVLSESFLNFKTSPQTKFRVQEFLERPFDMTEKFSVSYSNLLYLYALWNDVKITPYVAVGPDAANLTVYDGIREKEINYNDYYDSSRYYNDVYVEVGVKIAHNGKTYTFKTRYDVSITSPKAAVITTQPESVKVEPGEWAELGVTADHARKYVWYYYQDGYKLPLDQYKSMLFEEDEIEGETTDTLRVRLDGVATGTFYCAVKGSDGSTTNSNRANVTWGGLPEVTVFDGGEYIEGDRATFHLKAKYADDVTWFVQYRSGSNYAIYTTEEFEEETGLRCEVRRKKLLSGNIYETYLYIFDATESVIRSYSVGYELKNKIGKVSFNPDNVLPFTKKIEKPEITENVSKQEICYEGETLSFTFKALKMTDADWSFEKLDNDGYATAYDIDELREAFPKSTFETTFTTDAQTGESTATLNIINARAELFDYTIYPYAINETGGYYIGSSEPVVMFVRKYAIAPQDDEYRNIMVDCPEAGIYTLHVVGYDSYGRFVTMHSKTFDFSRGRGIYDLGKDFEDCFNIKIMLWDENLQPLCKAYQK